MATVNLSYETPRRCGMRRPGFYLVGAFMSTSCGRLPIPLVDCDCSDCVLSLKRARGWSIADAQTLFSRYPCLHSNKKKCATCVTSKIKRARLLWIDAHYYPEPVNFVNEAISARGISKRLSLLPRQIEIGLDWVLLAHRRIEFWTPKKKLLPGIFAVWRPEKIEYVKSASDPIEQLDRLEKRGITIVDVRPAQTSIYERIEA